MRFTHRLRVMVQAIAVVLAVALPSMLVVSSADARIGGGSSSGSRGARTFSAPPSTSTAPGTATPFNRTITQPGSPGMGGAPMGGGGFFNRGGGLLGGLAAGFLGAGLLGMLFGGGMFSGLGGLSSILGLVLQLGLIFFLVRMAMSWWQRRNMPSPAFAGAGPAASQGNFRSGMGFGVGAATTPLEILPADYEAFERLLGDIQEAWSNEDVARLHTLATPEMVSYFTRDLEQNRAQNQINKVTGTKLLQGDLAEAWREGDSDYASVAMRFSIVDKTIDRATGRVVTGSDQPSEVTEVWTFVRPRGATWELSAIQQTK
jgi:predicted lipid-binding transport protein (Tim44 family)